MSSQKLLHVQISKQAFAVPLFLFVLFFYLKQSFRIVYLPSSIPCGEKGLIIINYVAARIGEVEENEFLAAMQHVYYLSIILL